MSNLAIDELRSNLRLHLQGLRIGSTAMEIIADFRAEHARSIAKASRALEDIALTKLLNDVGTRITKRCDEQPDLFAGYSVPASIYLPSSNEKRCGVHKPTAQVTINELESWVEAHTKPRISLSARVIELKRLLEHIKPYAISNDSTVETALKAARFASLQIAS